MSVLFVTDDADDDISNHPIANHQEDFYKQLKELEYDLSSSSSVTSFSLVESSSSISVQSHRHYRQQHRRRRCRPQQCLVQHLLTYMFTLLILTNHLHWSLIFLSLSSIKIMSTQASTVASTTTTTIVSSTTQTTKRPISTPSRTGTLFKLDKQQCLPMDGLAINQLCSKACRAQTTPFEKSDHTNQLRFDTSYLSFCSNLLHQTIIKDDFFNRTTERECRQILNQIVAFDLEAQEASKSFATYMEAIDCASEENRYSIVISDCQKAYRTWACSVKIPYFYRNHLIPPCQTICDEVERVCPTFRPSDREPLFAGQPLFFCNGGIVTNSDYGQRPHCFDSCHVLHGSLQRPSALSSASSSVSNGSLARFIEGIVTTPTCFEIKPLPPPSPEQITSPLIFVDWSVPNNTSNTSLSASAITIISSSWSSIILTILLSFQFHFLQA